MTRRRHADWAGAPETDGPSARRDASEPSEAAPEALTGGEPPEAADVPDALARMLRGADHGQWAAKARAAGKKQAAAGKKAAPVIPKCYFPGSPSAVAAANAVTRGIGSSLAIDDLAPATVALAASAPPCDCPSSRKRERFQW